MEKFTEKSYKIFLQELKEMKDTAYQKFQGGLFKEDVSLIGIRTPILKEMAKDIAKGDYISFIKYNTHTYYEEKVLHGLLLGYIKTDFEILLSLIRDFLPYNDNWAINDLTCTNLKAFKKNKEDGFLFITDCLHSSRSWDIRFGLVLLLDYYVEEDYIDAILLICDRIQNKEYYVKMANAWLLSICFIKCREKTLAYFKKNHLDTWTYHKAISKICDSYRVSKEDKELLKSMKRKE